MTVNELIFELSKIEDKEKVVTLFDGYGWTNIGKIREEDITVRIFEERNPLFSDN